MHRIVDFSVEMWKTHAALTAGMEKKCKKRLKPFQAGQTGIRTWKGPGCPGTIPEPVHKLV